MITKTFKLKPIDSIQLDDLGSLQDRVKYYLLRNYALDRYQIQSSDAGYYSGCHSGYYSGYSRYYSGIKGSDFIDNLDLNESFNDINSMCPRVAHLLKSLDSKMNLFNSDFRLKFTPVMTSDDNSNHHQTRIYMDSINLSVTCDEIDLPMILNDTNRYFKITNIII